GLGDQRYVAEGLSEDLIDALSSAKELRIASRGAVQKYRAGQRDAREIGRELAVDFVVEGSVRRSHAGFRVTARLLRVAAGFQLWTRKFDVAEAQPLGENDAIARAIGQALSVELAPVVVAREDPEAVDLYLRAREAALRAFTGDPMGAANLFSQALERAPD